MVQVIIKKNFSKNGRYKIGDLITGQIVKVFVYMKNYFPEVRVKCYSSDGEELANDNLQSKTTYFYPLNFLPSGNFTDYFYNNGPLYIDIEGLSDSENIDFIKIYYI